MAKMPETQTINHILEELHGIKAAMVTKEDLSHFAVKADFSEMATKQDLKEFATKDDLKNFATKDDVQNMATKDDIKAMASKEDLHQIETRLTRQIRSNQETNIKYHLETKAAVGLLNQGHTAIR